MKLFYYQTPNPRKPCAVAKYLDSPVEFIRVDLTKGEQNDPAFRAVNPNGKVPALSDGDINLWEGHAIMVYLAYKAGSDLWPSDPVKQIEVMKWLNWDTAHFSRHAGRLYFNRIVKPKFGIGEPDQAEIEDATGYFKQFAAVLDGQLKGKKFLVDNQLTVADFAVASFLTDAEQAEYPLDGCNEIARWHDSLMELDAWRDPWPSQS